MSRTEGDFCSEGILASEKSVVRDLKKDFFRSIIFYEQNNVVKGKWLVFYVNNGLVSKYMLKFLLGAVYWGLYFSDFTHIFIRF